MTPSIQRAGEEATPEASNPPVPDLRADQSSGVSRVVQHPPPNGRAAGEAERFRTLLEINNAVISNLTHGPLFQAIAQSLRKVVPFDRAAIFLHDPDRDALRLLMLESSLPSSYFFVGLEMPAGESHVGWVFRHQQPLLRSDLETERRYPMEDRAFADGVRSYVIVPLVVRGESIGTLAVASTTPGQYTAVDAAFLQDVANQVAMAVENMRAYERIAALSASEAATAERRRTLLEINNAIVSNLTQQALFQSIVQALRRVVPFDRIAAFLHDLERDVLKLFVLESSLPSAHFAVGWEEASQGSNVGWVFQHRQPLLRRNLAVERQYPTEDLSYADGVRSFVIVPLLARGKAIGALSLASTQTDQYADTDVDLLQEAANQIALAIENMRSFEALQQEVALRRRAQETLRAITEGTASVIGDEFFASLVRHLAVALQVRCALLAECRDESKARTLAVWRGTGFGENIEYAVTFTPCSEVLAGRTECVPTDLQARYPAYGAVVGFTAESYLGVPILDSSAQVLGLLAVLDEKPMAENLERLATLKIFATRAGAELERKRVAALLHESSQLNQEVIGGASQGIIVYDTELRYVLFNRFMEELTGRRADEVLGRYAPEMFPFLREQGMEDKLRQALRGETVTCPDILVRMPTGREVWESNRYGPLRDAQGTIKGVIALVNDITPRKQAEEALRSALLEVEHLKNRLQAENVYLREEIHREHNFVEMVGSSPSLLSVLRQVEQVAPTDSTVLVFGETGTGKELIARAIQNRSTRKDRPLVKVNCAAISAGLVESELFGHMKGAFTGALERRIGRFELADGGTIFLDEVGELPLETQVKLLRVLQDGEFEPVGSSRTFRVDVRVIAATNRDLEAAVREGRFRSDLFYRLNVFPLEVPPLRARLSDLPQLVMFFVAHFSRKFGKRVDSVSQETMKRLAGYPWPGNIRELQNIIERGVVLAQGRTLSLGADLLPTEEMINRPSHEASAPLDRPTVSSGGAAPLNTDSTKSTLVSLEEMERKHILAALQQSQGKIEGPKGAAAIVNLHPNTLRSRMKKLGIRRPTHEIS